MTLGAIIVSVGFALSLLIYDHSVILETPAIRLEEQPTEHSESPLLLGIVPQSKPEDIYDRWSALADHLSSHLGQSVRIVASMSIPQFEKDCMEQRYDFIYCNPWHQAALAEADLYRPIACVKDKFLEGIIVADPDIESIKPGHTVAFPSPHAFAASMLTQQHMNSEGKEYTPEYVNTHDSVYRSVASGLFEYGGGVAATLRKMPTEIQSQLHIIWKSQPYAPHPICVSSKISDKVAEQLQGLLLELSGDSHELTSAGLSKLKPTTIDDYQKLISLFPSAQYEMGATRLLREPDRETAKRIQQIGALTYRKNKDGTVEVLLVQARTGKHWTIPKANWSEDDILSPVEVAEGEALEEAGIYGAAHPKNIGNYTYTRRKKTIREVFHVVVHQVKVTEELDEWPQANRRRKWCTTADATKILANDQLSDILANFTVGT